MAFSRRFHGSAWLTAWGALVFLTALELVKPQAFFYDDNFFYFLPAYDFNARAVAHGVIPQINFFQYLGQAWLNDSGTGVFYPFIYPAMWLSQASGRPGIGIEWLCWVHLAAAALVVERFARFMGCVAGEAIGAAWLYLTLPIVICASQLWVDINFAEFYVPLTFLVMERLLRKIACERLIALGIVKALFLLSGHVNYYALSLLMETGYLLLRDGLVVGLLRNAPIWLVSNFLGLLLALPAIGPMILHLGQSAERTQAFSLAHAIEVHVNFWTFLEAQFGIFRCQSYSFQAAWCFCGGFLFLVPLLIYGWKQPQVRLFGILMLAAFIFSTPAYAVIHYLPGYGAFRWPAKMLHFGAFFYVMTLALLMRRLPRHWPAGMGTIFLLLAAASNLPVTFGPAVRNGAEAFPRYPATFHLPLEQLRDGRMLLAGLSQANRYNPDFLSYEFATLARVPAFAGYDQLIAAQNKREALNAVFIGLLDKDFDAPVIEHLRSWSVRYYVVDKISPWLPRLLALPGFREIYRAEPVHILEDAGAAPLAYFEDEPQRALPVKFGDNELEIQTGGERGTLSISLVPLPGYSWQGQRSGSEPVPVHSAGRMRIENVSSSDGVVRIRYHEPWLDAFIAISLVAFLLVAGGLIVTDHQRRRTPKL
jgi:hypothetical protein